MVPLVKKSCDILVEKLGKCAESGKSVDVFRYACTILLKHPYNQLPFLTPPLPYMNTITHRTYGSFTMETIVATAFGRVIDIQRGEGDQLTQACAAIFSAFQEGTSVSLESMVLVLCELWNR